MNLLRKKAGENLPYEDGLISANILPIDEQLSKVAYETATFGIG
jgi:hypothetical protein